MYAIDLFCGGGGFSCGITSSDTDISILYGVDKNETAIDTYEKNHTGEGIVADLTNGLPKEILARKEEIDIVFGSPPCQGFSDARGSRHIETESNGLVFEFIAFVEEVDPEVVLLENVEGMTTISEGFMDAIITEFSNIGYSVDYEVVRASDFGTPQNRDRVFVGGTKIDSEWGFTIPTTSSNESVTVREAICDLPAVTDDGNVKCQPLDTISVSTQYVKKLRTTTGETTQHRAKFPADDEKTQTIIANLEPGEMYRSNRFGDRYRQVWDVLSEEFTVVEQDVLHFIARHRGRQDYRIKGKTVGPVWVEKICSELDYNESQILSALDTLYDTGWLRTDTVDEKTGYDLNTQSGIRPRYMRLTPNQPANTILTTDFKPREKLHPFENRGLSLREGARIQSFPDDFQFAGSFNEVATQIGNAVPPLLAKQIADEISPPSQS